MPYSKYPLLWEDGIPPGDQDVINLDTYAWATWRGVITFQWLHGSQKCLHSLDHDPVAQTCLVHSDVDSLFVVPVVILSPEAWKN